MIGLGSAVEAVVDGCEGVVVAVVPPGPAPSATSAGWSKEERYLVRFRRRRLLRRSELIVISR